MRRAVPTILPVKPDRQFGEGLLRQRVPLWARADPGEWCGREDSNFHGLSATTTSTLRVYQFRHDRT